MIGEKECRGYRPAIVEPAIDPQRGGGEKGMDAPVGGGQVYCDGCGKEKPLNQFPANPGVPGLCIPCNKIIAEQSGLQKCPKCGKEDEPLQKCFECGHEWYAPTAQDIMAVLQDEGWVNSMIDVVHKPYQGYWHDAINAFVAAVLERVNKTKGPHQPTDSRTNRKSR